MHGNNINFDIKRGKTFGGSGKSRTFAPHLKFFY